MVGSIHPVERRFPSSTASIPQARRFVADQVDRGAPGWVRLDDVLLATSELVTNAVEHGDGHDMAVSVAVDDAAVTITVRSSPSTAIVDPAMWVGPAAAGPSGRGLMIVRSVVDEVDVGDSDGDLSIRCVFLRS